MAGLLFLIPISKSRAKRASCQNQMGAICAVMQFYIEEHDGAFPSNLSSVVDVQIPSVISLLKCPATRTKVGLLSDVKSWSDYIYCYWPTGKKGTPPNYPLFYDRRLSNHEGKGINIFLVGAGGELRPQPAGSFFWDKNAEWLQKFKKEHPDLNIPLPEG